MNLIRRLEMKIENRAELEKIFEEEKSILKLLDYSSKYPGNVKSNISICEFFIKKYPEYEFTKKEFMSLVNIYNRDGNIDGAFCRVCGKLCNIKSDYTFHSTCCKECGRKVAAENTSKTYQSKSEEEKRDIQRKREATVYGRYGVKSVILSQEVLDVRREKFGGSISPFNKKEVRDKIKQDNIEKHDGLYNSFQWEEVKNKSKLSKLERYNDEKYNNVEKARQTNMERYNSNSYLATEECKEIAKKKALEKYGVEHFTQADEVKEKIAQTNLEKYGKRSYLATDEFKERSRKVMLELYGVEYNVLRKEVRDKSRAKSKINEWWAGELGITELEYNIGRYNYDLKKDNILIEINPSITHNCQFSIFKNDKPKEQLYHYNKTRMAEENGFSCIHIWDWDDIDKLKNWLIVDKEVIYARDLVIKEVDIKECNIFLNQYHLQNMCNGQEIRLGLYNKEDELVEIMTFGKSRYNKKYEYELLRLCTKNEYKVIGGASKLFTHFINEYKPVSIISYCDHSKFNGKVYEQIGMTLLHENKPSKHWYNPKTNRHITDNLLRMRGYSQLHNDTVHKKGENNEILMLENGYLPVYDCGQLTYVWNSK